MGSGCYFPFVLLIFFAFSVLTYPVDFTCWLACWNHLRLFKNSIEKLIRVDAGMIIHSLCTGRTGWPRHCRVITDPPPKLLANCCFLQLCVGWLTGGGKADTVQNTWHTVVPPQPGQIINALEIHSCGRPLPRGAHGPHGRPTNSTEPGLRPALHCCGSVGGPQYTGRSG